MTQLFTQLLNWLTNMTNVLPAYQLDSAALDNVSSGLSVIMSFLNQVNYIIPLSDIALILGLDIGIRSFKLSLFVANWVIRRIVDAIP